MADAAGPADLAVETTAIPGLLVLRLPVHGDARGWFKESWQRAKMTALGLPDFGPVQHNVSYNGAKGVTRGVHAEPWDKLVTVATGRVFGAWVDLRGGANHGTCVTVEIDPGVAVFVPRGVGNSYQSLEDGTAYSYLVNDHWRPGITYPAVDLGDPALGIDWPIPLAQAEISAKDQANPALADAATVPPRRPLVLGAGGQLGRALAAAMPDAVCLTRAELDLADPAALAAHDWSAHDVVVNAAAMTAVDAAETPEGRREAWAVNGHAVAALARVALEHRLTLVHYSSDYVFDGEQTSHTEAEGFAPLGVYGQSKAAGDLAVSVVPRHYLLRTSWVVGDGANFVATMRDLARRGVSPRVVDDQSGCLTSTEDLAAATVRLLAAQAPFGTYNVTSGGEPRTWAQIAREVFVEEGRDPADVTGVSTAEYVGDRVVSPRPRHSHLDLTRLRRTLDG